MFSLRSLFWLLCPAIFSWAGEVRLIGKPERVFDKTEWAVSLDKQYENPFDYREVAVRCAVTGPGGDETRIDGFYFQDFEKSQHPRGWDKLTPKGEGEWRIRFAPREPGRHSWRVFVADKEGERELGAGGFVVEKKAERSGFVRRSSANQTHLEHSDGSPYYPVGLNICWPDKKGLFDFDRWLALGSEAGINHFRLWLGPIAWPLERAKAPRDGKFPDPRTGYVNSYQFPELLDRTGRGANDPIGGLGKIDLANAWRIDAVLDEAAKRGMTVMMCLESFNSLRRTQMWSINPYNAKNGGPIDAPAEFFTNEAARDFTKNRYRYVVARYGWRPEVFAWELFNEVDNSDDYDPKASTAWHQEMAAFLKKTDVNGHLVSTSFVAAEAPGIESLAEIDFTQSHHYDTPDMASLASEANTAKTKKYGKPHLLAEFGLSDEQARFRGGPWTDPRGTHIRSALWGSLASPGLGAALPWFWENYLEPCGLFPLFAPVARFAADVPWNRLQWTPVREVKLQFVQPPEESAVSLYVEPTQGSWRPAASNAPQHFAAKADGTFQPPAAEMSRILHGVGNHPELHNPVTFDVDYPQDGEFAVIVNKVSSHGGGKLKISVDGTVALEEDFPQIGKPGRVHLDQYNGPYVVTIPAGRHAIQVVNEGRDWVNVNYEFRNFLSSRVPPLNVHGMIGDGRWGVFYVMNRTFAWTRLRRGLQPRPVDPVICTINGWREGSYNVEIWEPDRGPLTSREIAAADGRLAIELPEISSDLALKIRPASRQ